MRFVFTLVAIVPERLVRHLYNILSRALYRFHEISALFLVIPPDLIVRNEISIAPTAIRDGAEGAAAAARVATIIVTH